MAARASWNSAEAASELVAGAGFEESLDEAAAVGDEVKVAVDGVVRSQAAVRRVR